MSKFIWVLPFSLLPGLLGGCEDSKSEGQANSNSKSDGVDDVMDSVHDVVDSNDCSEDIARIQALVDKAVDDASEEGCSNDDECIRLEIAFVCARSCDGAVVPISRKDQVVSGLEAAAEECRTLLDEREYCQLPPSVLCSELALPFCDNGVCR